MSKTGSRSMTEELAKARAYRDAYKEPRCKRGQAINTAKKAMKGLGLSLADTAVLDVLFASSQAQDWEEAGTRPIVWPSNDELCEATGLALTSVRRHLRALIRAGLMCPHDSPTGQRSGRRDASGRIIKAYGFDLSPIAVRINELREMAFIGSAEKAHRRETAKEWTCLRKDIARIVASGRDCGLVGDWQGYERRLAALIELKQARQPLGELIEIMRDLALEAEAAYKTAHQIDEQDLEPMGAVCGTPILTTTNLNIRICNHKRSDAPASHLQVSTAFGGKGSPNEPECAADEAQDENRRNGRQGIDIQGTVTPGHIGFACPALADYGCKSRNWHDLFAGASKLRPGLGISDAAWHDAIEALGGEGAAAAFALILQKIQTGDIKSAGGYLRGLVKKARAGELHLERSIFGLAHIRREIEARR